MATERIERRLAAILAADVAGYSRLVGQDEEGTLAALRVLRRELIDPAVAAHRGRIVKTTGDGLLVEFASVVDALRAAAAVQGEMAGRNADDPVKRLRRDPNRKRHCEHVEQQAKGRSASMAPDRDY